VRFFRVVAASAASAPLLLAVACGEGEPRPAPAATWLQEPLAAVRTSALAAGAGDSAPDIANPYAEEPGAETEGMQLYQAFNCGGCHGGAGGGGIGPPLADDQWIYGGSAANIYATIVQGRPNGMPAFGPSLQGEAVWKLAAYVRSLGGGAEGQGGEEGREREGERGPERGKGE
jgi:cytochrome c oxidase cbb3-type subunit 3